MTHKNTRRDSLFSKDIPEYKYVVTGPERTHISVSRNLKLVLETYQHHKNIRTLTEAIHRACALGIRYDLMRDDPSLPAVKELHNIILQNFKDSRRKQHGSP